MIRIREAGSHEELQAIFGFRYRIYVDEMGRPQKDADHDRRRIRDALDDTAINLAAWNDERIVGVARVNFARNGHLGMYEDFYEMNGVAADHPSRTSIVTRLMLAPEFRHSGLAVQMFCACFGIGMRHGIRWNFVDCNRPLVPLFLRFGYSEHLPMATHPEYGLVHRLRLDLLDVENLQRVKSPFLDVLPPRRPAPSALVVHETVA